MVRAVRLDVRRGLGFPRVIANTAVRRVVAVRAAVDRVNEQLSVIEKVRKFDFADEPFTIENEQMTPSMKIRRHILRQVYEDKIAALYKG